MVEPVGVEGRADPGPPDGGEQPGEPQRAGGGDVVAQLDRQLGDHQDERQVEEQLQPGRGAVLVGLQVRRPHEPAQGVEQPPRRRPARHAASCLPTGRSACGVASRAAAAEGSSPVGAGSTPLSSDRSHSAVSRTAAKRDCSTSSVCRCRSSAVTAPTGLRRATVPVASASTSTR